MADRAMLANSRARFVRASTIELMGQSAAIGRAQELVRRAALLETGVLIVAERGAETESVGRELHARSQSADRPWIAIECDTGDGARVERALFGRAADALTDLESVAADSRIAAARGGTLFLQDVAGLPAAAQARLARIARDGEARVEGQAVPTEMRLVASALPAIDGDVRENRFRADLYRRLAVSRIDLRPFVSGPRMCRGSRSSCSKISVRQRAGRLAISRTRPWRSSRRSAGRAISPSCAPSWNVPPLTRRTARSRSSRCCRHSRSIGRCHDLRRPATCARPAPVSSATTSQRFSSITAGAWLRPPRHWAFNVPISIERPASSVFQSRGFRSERPWK